MYKLWVLPYDCPEFADSDGWIEKWFPTETAARDWCADYDGCIDFAEFGVDMASIVHNGKAVYDD